MTVNSLDGEAYSPLRLDFARLIADLQSQHFDECTARH
jgi:hypothetical protein